MTSGQLVEAMHAVADQARVVIPLHPRGRDRLRQAGFFDHPQMQVVDPYGYLEFMGLVRGAAAVVTDSGGVQEETTILGVPCLTLRPNTERPVTITHGTNRLVAPGQPGRACRARSWQPDRSPTGRCPRCGTGRPARGSPTCSSGASAPGDDSAVPEPGRPHQHTSWPAGRRRPAGASDRGAQGAQASPRPRASPAVGRRPACHGGRLPGAHRAGGPARADRSRDP